ncbi:uncharacterized protein LOC117115819 isoform X6 [Anneissia japonica]|uniref:uncharacterized protein LOC117115819 isoform X6 n=1 Tax=Anneissia japonica TaxID=1529436 RepID=UPI0014259B3E|nr:uncharacterized protein LOC117115819 isoform X6 [Anneissia japonica]
MATGKALNTESKKVISKTHAYHDTEEKMVHFYDELAPDYDDSCCRSASEVCIIKDGTYFRRCNWNRSCWCAVTG